MTILLEKASNSYEVKYGMGPFKYYAIGHGMSKYYFMIQGKGWGKINGHSTEIIKIN